MNLKVDSEKKLFESAESLTDGVFHLTAVYLT